MHTTQDIFIGLFLLRFTLKYDEIYKKIDAILVDWINKIMVLTYCMSLLWTLIRNLVPTEINKLRKIMTQRF